MSYMLSEVGKNISFFLSLYELQLCEISEARMKKASSLANKPIFILPDEADKQQGLVE